MGTMPNLYDILSELNYMRSSSTASSSSSTSNASNNNNNNKIINTFPYTLKEFNNFLIRTHCEENLEFFIMTRQFLLNDDKKSVRSSTLSSHSSRNNYSSFDLQLWDDQIYNIFIKVDSPKECNLPQYIRELFDDCHNKDHPPRQVFIIQAIQHILGLLLDAYKRFVQYIQQVPDEEWERRRIIDAEQAALDALEVQQLKLEQLNISKRPSPITRSSSASARPHKKKNISSTTTTNNNTSQHTESHSSILFKSRKFFNKFKKTIQI